MSELINPILQWLNDHPNLSGLGTFIISAAESVAIIGTIIPGSVMMTAIGTLAGAGVIPLWPTIFWAILGAIVGDGISYWIGHAFKDRLYDVWPFRNRPQILRRGEAFFNKYGGMSVFVGRFVGPVRALVPLVAGSLRMPPLKFYIANILSAIGWAPAYMLPGILLGAVSLELPPDIAVHAIVMLFLFILFIILCTYLFYKLFWLISNQINQTLTTFWHRLEQSRYFFIITKILKHHDAGHTHGQLSLAFYFIFICFLLSVLTLCVAAHGSQSIMLNDIFFYLARSLRTPNLDIFMLGITFLGEKYVLLPVALILTGWLAYQKNWHTAWHVLLLSVLSICSVEVMKHVIHSPRPWGITQQSLSFSYPSGHMTLATAFYMGAVLLLARAFNITRRAFIYWLAGILLFMIGASRIYLGAHWLTDVLGGLLLGTAILMFVLLSYYRKAEKPIQPWNLTAVIFLVLSISYMGFCLLQGKNKLHSYTQLDWPEYRVPLKRWWQQQGDNLPTYRINRFGFSSEVLNLQWIGELEKIKTLLLNNGWEIPTERDWINVIHRITDVESTSHLPLVSPLYLDKQPALVLTKRIEGKKLVILRLWDPHVIIQNTPHPLWVGTVNVTPRTYSWIFNKNKQLALTSTLLANKMPAEYEIKSVQITNAHMRPKEQTILLIKTK